MNILLVSQVFYPEDFKCNNLAFELSQKGHHVTVLSAIPNYPYGKFFKGYGLFKRRREIINGVEIIRTPVIPRGKGGKILLALNYISFAFFASLYAIWLAYTKRFSLVLVHQVSPVTMGIPAVILKKIQKIPMYFWVLDIWPESLTAGGGITNKHILNFFRKLTNCFYRNSTRILISSRGFESSICQNGDYKDRIEYFPNWVDKEFKHSQPNIVIPKLPNGFKVLFAGNMGESQNFEAILKAAKLLNSDKNIHFIFLGDGRKRKWVEEQIIAYNIHDTVHWLGRYPIETMPKFFEQADIMLVSLKDEPIFKLTAPAKIQAYMSAGKPIIAMLNGEGSFIINEAKCGFTVPANDAISLVDIIRKASTLSKDELSHIGKNGQEYCFDNFTLELRISQLLELFYKDNIQ